MGAQPPSTRTASTRQILLLAAWAGLAFGLCEGLLLYGLQETGLATWTMIRDGVGLPILWISPVFDLCLFLLAALLWAVAGVALPRFNLIPFAFGFFTWMGSYSLFASAGRLSEFACASLGLGLAALAERTFRANPEKLTAVFHRTIGLLISAVILLFAGVSAAGVVDQRVLEPRLYARLPAAPHGAPNVLLIVLDAARANHLSAYGYSRATSPNFDRLAREGALFLNAYSTSSWSLPSHSSLITGLYPFEHHADPWPLRPEYPRLAEYLSARGYTTASFAGNTFWCTHASGFAQGFAHHEDYFTNAADMVSRTLYGRKVMKRALALVGIYREANRKTAANVNAEMLEWLERRSRESPRPFFVFLNYFDAHDPVFPPPPYDGRFAPAAQVSGRVPIAFKEAAPGSVSAAAAQAQVDAYDSALAYIDAQLGALWLELERRGLAENTLLIVTSDHGEALGEEGWFGHRGSLHAELIHVPLLLRLPGRVPEGVRPAQPVSLRSIPAAITQLASLEGEPRFAGESLATSFRGNTSIDNTEEPVLAEVRGIPGGKMPAYWPLAHGDLRSLVTRRWHYIERSDGFVELFDLEADPSERSNLAGTAAGRDIAEAFRQRLARMVNHASDAAGSRPSAGDSAGEHK